MSNLKILHVNDAAGVAGSLAKYQTRLGHNVSVVVRDGYDSCGLQRYYSMSVVGPKRHKGILWRSLSVLWFYCYVAWCGRKFDVIHIHSQYLVWFFLPFKNKVIEFHGTDVRRYPSKRWGIDIAVTSLFLKLYSRGFIQ